MALTRVEDCDLMIYSYLGSHELWTLRAVSKAIKATVEKTKLYKKNASMATQAWNINFKSSLMGTLPAHLHSNGKKLRILNRTANHLWNVDLNTTFHTRLIHLEKVKSLKKVLWNDTEIAIVRSVFPETQDEDSYDPPTGYRTTIFDTENGRRLTHLEDISLLPIGWYHRQLLMGENKQDHQAITLFAWNVWNEETKPLSQIFSWDLPNNGFETACQNGKIYCLKYKEIQPFAKLDLQHQSLLSLNYQMDCVGSECVSNFGLTDTGNIFFSKGSLFNLVNGDTSDVISRIALPIIPSNIKFQSPLMSCYQGHQFLIYDIRKFDRPLYKHHYVTQWEQFKQHILSFQSIAMPAFFFYSDPFYSVKIREIAFHNHSLFVCKEDDSIDHFDLTAGSTFLNTLKFW